MKDLTYRYPGTDMDVLNALDMDVEHGSFISLIGRSGSGKTTLVRCISGLIPHDLGGALDGSIAIYGKDTRRMTLKDHMKRVGIVFQDPHLQQFSTGLAEELAFPLENVGMERDEMVKRIRLTVKEFGLGHLTGRRISELSGGEKQLLAVATALIRRPDVIILDEPTSELDPVNVGRLKSILERLKGRLTIILVEHRFELLDIADRILGIRDGRIVSDLPPDKALTAASLSRVGLEAPPDVLGRESLGPLWRQLRSGGCPF